jgi:iron complex transport system ATP-binding protein
MSSSIRSLPPARQGGRSPESDGSTPRVDLALTASDLTFCYPNSEVQVISGVSVRLAPGDLTAIIGPNGSGKTTLLRLLSGALSPRSGQVSLDGRPMSAIHRQEIARRVAVVPQELAIPFPFSVRQLVEMGRTPHLSGSWMRHDSESGRGLVSQALEATGTAQFASRPITELSGGERQRAIIAMALAQQPAFLLLDEPTTHLDIQHQVEILRLLQVLNRERHIAVMATMHDLNLAAMYFDQILLLDQGRIVSAGAPAEVFSEDRLRRVFQTGIRVEIHPTLGTPNIILVPGPGQTPLTGSHRPSIGATGAG